MFYNRAAGVCPMPQLFSVTRISCKAEPATDEQDPFPDIWIPCLTSALTPATSDGVGAALGQLCPGQPMWLGEVAFSLFCVNIGKGFM